MTNLQLVILAGCFLFYNRAAPTTLSPNNTSPPDVCNNYKVLSGGDRAQGRVLKPGWYRFHGAAGDRRAEKCVPKVHCGTYGTVCYYILHSCCYAMSIMIRVKNCGGYSVYELKNPRYRYLWFCGNRGAATTTSILPPNTTLPLTTTPPPREPDGVPQNVRGQNRSSTSILVMWDEVPANKQNGIITGYTITYHSQTENDNGSVQVNASVRQTELTDLKEYVNYNITVFASTVKGDGPASDPVIVVRTDQDKPNGAPQNVRGQSRSSTRILVMWDEVPANKQNGIITGYTITYQSETENDNGIVLSDAFLRQTVLTNLKEYVSYNITVFASTVKGDGPASDPVIAVRTDQDTPTTLLPNNTSPPADDIVDECQLSDLNECHEKAKCTKTPESYQCTCLDGYFGNGTHCQDVDECQAPDLNKCHEKAVCTNTLGSYNCTCLDGYSGDGTILCQDCSTPVGVEGGKISDQQMSASSHWNQHYGSNGRLNNRARDDGSGLTRGGWCTDQLDKNQYLQVDLGRVRSVSGVATQGYMWEMFVSSYRVNYSTDGYSWRSYKDRGDSRSKIFQGNWDDETVIKKVFSRRIFARYIRFNPLAWNANGYICMRVEIYECLLTKAPPSIYYVDPPTETGTEENVTLTCYANGLPQPTFTWITPDGHTISATAPVNESEVLDDGSENRRGKIVQGDGSLLIFNTRDVDQGIYKCVAKNVMGQHERSVNLTIKEDIVGVDAAITIEEVFDKELENKSSAIYQKMEKEVKRELTALFRDIEGFKRVEILKFTNGSIKVHFRVVVQPVKDKEPLKVEKEVGETLKSVKDDQIGRLKVKSIELREPPPPPVNVQSADVKQTEAVVTWSHPELYDMYAISSYSLQVRKFGTKKWTQFTTTRDVNHRLTNLDPDTVYFVRLKSENKYGKGKPSDNEELRTEKVPEGNGLTLALVIVSVLFVVVTGIAAVFVYRRWKKKRTKSGYNTPDEEVPMNPVTVQPAETNPSKSTIQLPWREIPRDRLTLDGVLGRGEFGMVVKADLTEDDGNITPCAVKKLKDGATESDLKDLLNELEIMATVGHHPNLVNLIGACSSEGQLMIVVEFAEHGNLQRYLRDHRKQNYHDMHKYSLDISSAERLRIACDVAEGMKHLATMRWVHRDLAARNVLLGEGMIAKVSDFGLTRDLYTTNVYEKTSGGKVPVKWLAVESLEQGLYTSQSDVWSFGVLLWEIETGGCTPYAGISTRQMLSHLKAGNRLEKPHYCSPELYSVMFRCWNANPKKRPTFEELSDELRQMCTKVTDYLAPVELEPSYDYVTTPDDPSVTAAISSTSPLLAECTNETEAVNA